MVGFSSLKRAPGVRDEGSIPVSPMRGQAVCLACLTPGVTTSAGRAGVIAIIWAPIRAIATRRRLAPLLGAVVLVAAACGGGGDNGTPARSATVRIRRTPSGPCQIARADIDGDGAVSIFDVTQVTSHFGQHVPPAPELVDQDGDKAITILDVHLVEGVFLQQVNDCP